MAGFLARGPRVKAAVIENPLVRATFSPETIEPICHAAGHRWRRSFWSPTLKLTAFLLQVLDTAKTLRAAVAMILTQHTAGLRIGDPSADPAAYCQARMRLPRDRLAALSSGCSDFPQAWGGYLPTAFASYQSYRGRAPAHWEFRAISAVSLMHFSWWRSAISQAASSVGDTALEIIRGWARRTALHLLSHCAPAASGEIGFCFACGHDP